MSEYNWRYDVTEDGTIYRGRVYRLGDVYGDLWQNYWDGDFTTAFTVYWRGYPDLNGLGGADEDNARAIEAWKKAREYGQDPDEALNRLARRITGNWESTFISVSLEHDYDLYALAWGGDPDNEWRDEIDALNCGDVYRCEVERILPEGGGWIEDDDVCEEWYGSDKAEAALAKMFPLDEFPAELLIEDRAS